MSQVEEGNTVKVHYTGKLDDGTVFDSSRDGDPIEFTVGSGQVIPGFESAVVGMDAGDSKTVEIPPEKAYGERRDDAVVDVSRAQLPEDLEPKVGDQLQAQQSNGQTMLVKVVDVDDDAVTVDANHPLAGENLTFDIEVVEVG